MSKEVVPEYFKCPISLQIMSDPIILSSGHTFDRSSIHFWFSTGNSTCPITKLPLSNPPLLIPNHILRSLISHYTKTPNSVHDSLSQVSVARSCLPSTGIGNPGGGGLLGTVVAALRGRSPAIAATVLTSLATTEGHKAVIGAHPGLIQTLVSLLITGKERDRKAALLTLVTICSFPENRRRAVDHGAVPILIKLARSDYERAIEVIGLLARCRVGREELVKCDGVVEALVRNVMNGSCKQVQYGLLITSYLSYFSERVKKEVKSKGILEICLGLIHDDNHKISKLASHLVRVLQQP